MHGTIKHTIVPPRLPKNPFALQPTDRVALFCAHTDDIAVMLAFAAGEAIARLGPDNVYSYIATDGEDSTLGDQHAIRIERARRLRACDELMCLGGRAEHVELPNLGDGMLMRPERYVQLTHDVALFMT